VALSKRKQALVDEMNQLGFSDQEIEWHLRKSTIAQMQLALDNDEALRIIAKLAADAGKNRFN